MSTRRKNIMLGTAGHVDHGKTALVKLLTGCDTDTLSEEKQRGLTIDLGFAPCRLADDRIVGVVDVPGHVDFIRNMVAGAHGIDVVILVVAADDGVMPQTLEHLDILTLMGLRHGVVALTKIDLVDAHLRERVANDVRQLLAGTFLEAAPVCPISNVTGEGFEGFFDALNQAVQACVDRPCHGLFRVWIEDVFTIRGFGTVLTGIPTSGRVAPGDLLHLVPAGAGGRVRRLEVYGEDAPEGRAGECVALNVADISHTIARRGMVLAPPDVLTPVTQFEAELRILPTIEGRFTDYFEVHLHVGTASVLGRVALLEGDDIGADQRQFVQFRLEAPLGVLPGDRFVIRANVAGTGRSGLHTIGGGCVLGVSNTRLRRRRSWTLELLARRRDALGRPEAWCERMLAEGESPWLLRELVSRCWLSEAELLPLFRHLRDRGAALEVAPAVWTHPSLIQRVAERVRTALNDFHRQHPRRLGMSRDELAETIGGDPRLLSLALAWLLNQGWLEPRGEAYAQAGWQVALADTEEQQLARIAEAFRAAGWTSPSVAELADRLHLPPARVETVLRLLVDRGDVVRLDERTLMHRSAVAAAQDVALQLFARAPSFSTMEFRDALGVSRKYAVPLLDYLDATRFTVRNGNQRTPGAEARQRIGRDP